MKMNKKIIAICLMLAVVSLSLTALTASDDLLANDETLTINGIEFNIPAGYTKDMDESKMDYVVDDYNKASTYILKNGDKMINITVGYSTTGGEITEYQNIYGTNKTISGVDGSFLTDSSKIDNNEVAFLHALRGKSVYISAPDEATLSQVIVE